MLTLRHAAEQFAAITTATGRLALAESLGFTLGSSRVDPRTAAQLGLPEDLAEIELVRGRGALRALLLTTRGAEPLRAHLSRVAAALSSHTSHVLWLLIGASERGDEVGVACWSSAQRAPRVVALVAQRNRIVASDAEALSLLAASSDGDDLLVHTRWCELLGREALSRRFYRILEQRVQALADSLAVPQATDRSELALLCVSRLLFLSFLEAKGWLDDDRAFLAHRFDACMARDGQFHKRVLLPLFFGTLNTPIRNRAAAARKFGTIPFLNGGLFARSALERRHASAHFSDDALGALFGQLLGAHRFTAREGEADWSDAVIDPEMLGRAFESLMAARDRRTSGAFYTPQPLVAHVVDAALAESLSDHSTSPDDILALLAGTSLTHDASTRGLLARLRDFTVLDPACGSGAFLVYALERLARLYQACGDTRGIAAIRRDVLSHSIHGVDINPTAVWLCEMRLWLSVVIESDERRISAVPPLPNLDCNVRVGDALSGDAFVALPSLVGPPSVLVKLRDRYVRAAGPKKAPLRRSIEREERKRAIAVIDAELLTLSHRRRERLRAQRARDLFGDRTRPNAAMREEMRAERLRTNVLRRDRRRLLDGGALPFAFPSHFGAAHTRGGFDLVIGNPPWVRLHNIPAASRITLRARYTVFRNAAWERGAIGGNASRGFSGQVDLAALFVERSLDLLSPTGSLALLLPAKLWSSLAGGGVRRLLGERASVRAIEDWSEAPASFEAAVYPSVLIASRQKERAPMTVTVRRRSLEVSWQATDYAIRLHPEDAASPWLLLPRDVRTAFNRIAARGIPLGDAPLGRATLGVKCGCNEAFIVEAVSEHGATVSVECQGRTGHIERDQVRPLLRGDAVTAWSIQPSRAAIIWTHDAPGRPLRSLPTGTARWLAPWRRQLVSRTDFRSGSAWWTLFRTEAAKVERPRVVWSDFGRIPRAAILPAGDPTVPLNSCYVIACDDHVDALALTALLNSQVAAAFLNTIAEPARGGWRRYLAWTVALLPIPADWVRAREVLAPIAERAVLGDKPTADELLVAACRAYRLRRSDVAPLVAWCHSPKSD